MSNKLNIRESKTDGIYVENLTEYITESLGDCLNLLKFGERFRKTRQTKKNNMSSRSHTIFKVTIQGESVNKNGCIKVSKLNEFKILKIGKLNFCDLAGFEQYNKDKEIKQPHFNEMVKINSSLTSLGIIINALVNKEKHIPYRIPLLTRLLQDSLGGNTRTYMICTISPSK